MTEPNLSGPLQSFPGKLGFARDLSRDQIEASVCMRDAVPRRAHGTSKGPRGMELSVFQKPQQLVLTTAPLTCDSENIFVSSQYFL